MSPKILQKEVKDIDTSAKDKVEELMVRHGLCDIPLTDLNKDKAVNDLLVAEVIITRTLALDRFFAGLIVLALVICCEGILLAKMSSSPHQTRSRLILKP